jgi:nucleotide-binding universal stress UspA family protein
MPALAAKPVAVLGRKWLAASPAGRPGRRAARGREPVGPVLFAYDGSQMAKAAIAEAGHQLAAERDALVLTVWRTFSVGFIPEPGREFDAACGDDVRQAAEQTAAHGATLASAAGFRAQPLAVEGTPASKAIMEAADGHQASLVVLGSHRRAGLGGRVGGSVAADVATRSQRPVRIVHYRGKADDQAPEASASASVPGR